MVAAFVAFVTIARCDEPEETNEKAGEYEATWESLDTRPLPKWYDAGKIGIMVTWGPYSVPGVGSEWFWWALRGN